MERRYLAMVVGLAATFALFSGGIDADMLARFKQPGPTLLAELKCATLALGSKALSQVSPSLAAELDRVRVLAELNLSGPSKGADAPDAPSAPAAPATVEIAVAAPECPELQRAQQQAMRESLKMQRKLDRVQQKVASQQRQLAAYSNLANLANLANVANVARVNVDFKEAVDRQFEVSVREYQNRLAVEARKIEIAAKAMAKAQEKMSSIRIEVPEVELPEIPVVDAYPQGAGCKRTIQIHSYAPVAREVVSKRTATKKLVHQTPVVADGQGTRL